MVGVIDKKLKRENFNYKFLGNEDFIKDVYRKYNKIPLVITPDNPNLREKLSKIYYVVGFHFCNLIHPSAKISRSIHLGSGVIICHSTNISYNVEIGDFVKINVGANIMHDTIINKFSTIAPGAIILGRVNVGKNCYIGANSTIFTDIRISDDVVIGAGSVVIKNLDSPGIYAGVPVKKIK
ncbi:MAG: acetyltransferase [Candidatus Helarchaeota archaeon]